MKVREPLSHWNNFTVPELKEIMKHCVALGRLGIAQDEEMMISVERDIAIRERKQIKSNLPFDSRLPKIRQIVPNSSKMNKRTGNPILRAKQLQEDCLLEQNV